MEKEMCNFEMNPFTSLQFQYAFGLSSFNFWQTYLPAYA